MADRGLRILIFANLPPYVLGGAENQSARLAAAWVAAGTEVTVAGHRLPTGRLRLGEAEVGTRWNARSATGDRITIEIVQGR